MPTIEIVSERIDNENEIKTADIEITDAGTTYAWRVGGIPIAEDTQTHLDSRVDELWRVAEQKGEPVDTLAQQPTRALLKAFALLVLDELNTLRAEHGLPQRTPQQLVNAIKNKLRE